MKQASQFIQIYLKDKAWRALKCPLYDDRCLLSKLHPSFGQHHKGPCRMAAGTFRLFLGILDSLVHKLVPTEGLVDKEEGDKRSDDEDDDDTIALTGMTRSCGVS